MNFLFSSMVVFCGAGLGGVLRHAANCAGLVLGVAFPWSTLFVNVTGCLIMGLLAGWFTFRGEGNGQAFRLFLTTGVLGGYTTFSAFSLDAALLWERGQLGLMALYVGSSVVATLVGVFAGLGIMRSLL
jgi:CrcB protein